MSTIRIGYKNIVLTSSTLLAILVAGMTSYSLANPGIYNSLVLDRFMPGTLSQDLISLVAAVGLMLCVLLIWRGSNLAWLLWLGIHSYLFYAYAIYCFEKIYTSLFLLYVAALGLSVYGIILFFVNSDFTGLRMRPDKPMLRKSTAVFFVLMTLMFYAMWIGIVWSAMQGGVPADGNTIYVLDLSFFLPLLLLTAVMLWRNAPLSSLLATALLLKLSVLGISVFIGGLISPWFGLEVSLIENLPYILMSLPPAVLCVWFLHSLRDD